MELMDAISCRRTLRDFSEREVPFEIVEKALNAGLKAPSYNHKKEWDFLLVRDKDIRLALAGAEEMTGVITDEYKKEMSDDELLSRQVYTYSVPRQKKMLMTAAELLVVVFKPKTPVAESKRVFDLNCLASVWCCIENIMLSLAEDNVFGTIVVPKYTSRVKEILGIPEDLEVPVMIPFGYRAPDARIIPPKEVDLHSVLHTDKW